MTRDACRSRPMCFSTLGLKGHVKPWYSMPDHNGYSTKIGSRTIRTKAVSPLGRFAPIFKTFRPRPVTTCTSLRRFAPL